MQCHHLQKRTQRRWCGKHIINPLLLQNISTLIQPSPPMPKWLPWVVCVTLTFAIKICKAIVNQVSVSRSAVSWWIWGLKCGWKCAVCEGEATVCPWLCQAAPDTHTHMACICSGVKHWRKIIATETLWGQWDDVKPQVWWTLATVINHGCCSEQLELQAPFSLKEDKRPSVWIMYIVLY